ncbi:MAG: MAPEG family protein, partial [Kangiellaceae bacterium]|nr:MAPEG family protein [Kangiellaceae bacterium]
ILLGLRKSAEVKSKSVDLKKASLDNKAWPSSVVQVSNNIASQFESPMLFYTLCFITYLTGSFDILAISLAWSYVALRYFHSYIHTGSNFVPYRYRAFVLSLLIIIALVVQVVFQMANHF